MRRGLLSSDEASDEDRYPLPSGRPSRRARGIAPVAAASAASSSSAFAVAAQAAAARSGWAYVGFTEWRHMAAAVQGRAAGFESMANNRLVNQNVVNERIAINEDLLKRFGAYADFGTVILIVVRSDLRAIYRIMDGQHRVRAMQELSSTRDIQLPLCRSACR